MILAGSFPRKRAGGTPPLPTPGAPGSRRHCQEWAGARAWEKARLVRWLWERSCGKVSWLLRVRRLRAGALLPALPQLPAPPRCALARTKPICLYLFVMSDDAEGG